MSPEEALEKDVVSQKAISSYEIERSLLTDAYFQLKTTTTKIEKSEKALLQKDRMLSMLSSINQVLVYSKDETSLLNDACRIVVEIGGYRMAWVGFAEHNEEKSILSVAYVGFESGYLESLKLTWADTERGRGPTGTAIRTGKLDIAHDIATDPKMIPWREDALKRGYLSSIALPLRIGDETFGALTIYTDNKIDAFNSDEVKMLEELTTDLAFGIIARRTDIERKRVEIEREQFLKFFNLSSDIMVIADPNGNFKKVNPSCLKVLGYSEEDLISKPFIDFVLQDDKQSTLDEMARQIKSGSSLNFENRYVCKDGSTVLLSWLANFDKTEGITYATARDITERKKAEIELMKKNRMLRMLSNVNQGLIRAADEKSLVDDVSNIIVDIGGYHMLWIGFAEQDEAKTVRPVAQAGFGTEYLTSAKISWADNEHGRGPTGTAIRTGKTQIARDILKDPKMTPWLEAAVKHGYKSSIALPLSSEGKPFGALNIYATETDAFNEDEVAILEEISKDLAFGITTLREDIDRKETEKRFKIIFENTNDGIAMVDQVSMKFTLVNSAICRMLGYTPEEFVNLAVADIHPQESLPYVLEQFDKQARGELKIAKDLPVKRKDGSVFYVDINTSTMTIGGKKYSLGVFRDITERQDAEKKEKEYVEGVENMNKLMVGRELKMIELKDEIRELKQKLPSK